MDTQLAALFYIGIIAPTLITISVFIGFLICLYKRNLRRKMTRLSRRALPAIPQSFTQAKANSNKISDRFDKCSQHSADSAIDVADVETSLEEKLSSEGLVLDARELQKSNHSYQNEGMLLTTEVEVHGAGQGRLIKGYYPSHEKLNEEIHSQVKIYEKMDDVQRVALQMHHKGEPVKQSEKHLVAAAAKKQFSRLISAEKATSRYTSTSKLVPGACPINTNQLDRSSSSNYASYSPSWYATDMAETNKRNMDIYRSQNQSTAASWKPNISASCSSNTDNYSMESSQV